MVSINSNIPHERKMSIKKFICLFTIMLLLSLGKIFGSNLVPQNEFIIEIEQKNEPEIKKVKEFVLENGLRFLVLEDSSQPKVAIRIFYDVGSKDEKDDKKGLAHLLEHMVFKGTNDKGLHLSESDIKKIAQKLSGTTNAYTCQDYTEYSFDFPSTQWKEIFPVIADCMSNAKFDDEQLNSEMKVVIQELKMGKDNFERELLIELYSLMFSDHPYRHRVIGYKQNLWNFSGSDLYKFYQKYYRPNNAVVVVVGDVKTEDVFQEASNCFSLIPLTSLPKRRLQKQLENVARKSFTLFRNIQQPKLIFGFSTPGSSKKQNIIAALTRWILATKKNCRLYKKMVEGLRIATSIESSCWPMFDYIPFCIYCSPKNIGSIQKIEDCVSETLQEIITSGVTDDEINRAVKNYKMWLLARASNFGLQASIIGQSFLATGDPEYGLDLLKNESPETLKEKIRSFITRYLRPSVMHTATLLPIPKSEKEILHVLQKESDEEDKRMLASRVRTTMVEPPRYAEKITPKYPESVIFPKPNKHVLSNGLNLLIHENMSMERITIALKLKASSSCYDPDDKPGLYKFLTSMMSEGTKNYTAEQLAEFLEDRAMVFSIVPGKITIECLSQDIESALQILKEIVCFATFEKEAIEQVRSQMQDELKTLWDDPKCFSNELFTEIIYKNHPWGKNYFGTEESIQAISQNDLLDFYHNVMSPDGATLVVVGAVSQETIINHVQSYFDSWKHVPVSQITFPSITSAENCCIDHYIERDQVVLMLGNLSVNRYHSDYEKLLIFDQIFGDGALNSLSSRLFQLREKNGWCYTIDGSLTCCAAEQPGMFYVKTIVSPDDLEEATRTIKETIDTVADSITDEEVEEAKRAILYSQVEMYNTSRAIADTFLLLNRLKLPFDYYDNRYQEFESITRDDVVNAVKKYMNSDSLVVVRVGRV